MHSFFGIFTLIIITLTSVSYAESEEGKTIPVEPESLVHDVKKIAPPLQQIESGIALDEIRCNSGLVLVKRISNDPVCIKPTSVYSLFNRNWVLPESVDFNSIALSVAEVFVKTGSTFAFDGMEDTLHLEIIQIRESFPEQFVIKADFDSSHGGYGDRTDQMMTQVITPHSMELVVANGKIMSAIIDDKWDEVNQILLSNGDTGSETIDFILEYKREGGIAGISDSITIISIANEIIVQRFDKETVGTINDEMISEIWQIINENKFLEDESNFYPPTEGSADYFTYTLTIMAEDKEVQVSWTDTSETIPTGAETIAQKVNDLASQIQDE
ncbi:MAG: hypothetical protein ACT4OW_05645 [Nitrososphaerota archaeon]